MNQPPASVLIIDADAASRNYLSSMLVKEGYQVLTASLGREGLISAWKDQPGVIVFDPNLPDVAGLDMVARLRQNRRTAEVVLVALSSREDSQAMSDLLAAGCNDYMLKSGNALSMLIEMLKKLTSPEEKPAQHGKMIVFLSAKGGMGTSSLCLNLAMCAASENPERRVAVLDLVLPVGSLANIIGADDRINLITTALLPPETVTAEYFTENLPRISGWLFHFLAGSQDPASVKQLLPERINGIVNSLLESHHYLFVDVGRTLSRISLPILQQANSLVFVLGTDLATCTHARTVYEYLRTLGLDAARFYSIQNRSVGLEGMTRPEAEKLIGMPIRLTLPNLGDNLTISNNRHEPFISRFPEDSNTMTLKQITAEIIELSERSSH